MYRVSQIVFLFLLGCVVPAALAQDEGVVVLSETVTGNQEQPKVLYIVPWQAATDDTILNHSPLTQLHSEVFQHVERADHNRELQYLQALSPTRDGTPQP